MDYIKNKKIFVISTGRTGTRFFVDYFNRKKLLWGCKFYHEPKPKIDQFCYDYYINNYSFKKSKPIFTEYRQEIIMTAKGLYLESNGILGFIHPLIRELLNDSFFIFVIRDPVSFTKSVSNRIEKNEGLVIQKYAKDYNWPITADMLIGDKYYGKWAKFDMYEKIAWVWRLKNSTFLKYVKKDENSLVVRFEDIFLEPNKPGVDQINDFLKNTVKTRLKIKKTDPLFNQKVNTNKTQIDKTFGPEYIKNSRYFKELVGDLAERFNYTLP